MNCCSAPQVHQFPYHENKPVPIIYCQLQSFISVATISHPDLFSQPPASPFGVTFTRNKRWQMLAHVWECLIVL